MAANRVAAINPPIDDTEFQYRPPGSYADLQNQAEISPKGKPIRNFSIDPTSSIRTSIADAIFADAISETSTVACPQTHKPNVAITVRVKIITGSFVTLEKNFPRNDRSRYRLEIRMNSFNYHYRFRLGVRSHTFIFIDSQLAS